MPISAWPKGSVQDIVKVSERPLISVRRAPASPMQEAASINTVASSWPREALSSLGTSIGAPDKADSSVAAKISVLGDTNSCAMMRLPPGP